MNKELGEFPDSVWVAMRIENQIAEKVMHLRYNRNEIIAELQNGELFQHFVQKKFYDLVRIEEELNDLTPDRKDKLDLDWIATEIEVRLYHTPDKEFVEHFGIDSDIVEYVRNLAHYHLYPQFVGKKLNAMEELYMYHILVEAVDAFIKAGRRNKPYSSTGALEKFFEKLMRNLSECFDTVPEFDLNLIQKLDRIVNHKLNEEFQCIELCGY